MPARQPPPPAVAAAPTRCRIRRDRERGLVVASCVFPGPGGPVAITMTIPQRHIGRLVDVDLAAGGAVSGNVFRDIGRGFSSVMQDQTVQAVASTALALYGVPPGVTKTGMQLAGGLSKRAADGDPRAAARQQQIRQAAAQGDPTAQVAQSAIEHAGRSRDQVALAVNLLREVQQQNPRAVAALTAIAEGARAGDPGAERAARAIRVVLSTGFQASQQPAPPAVRGQRALPPPPPAVRGERRAPPPPAFQTYQRGGNQGEIIDALAEVAGTGVGRAYRLGLAS